MKGVGRRIQSLMCLLCRWNRIVKGAGADLVDAAVLLQQASVVSVV